MSTDREDEFSRLSTMTKVPEYLALGLPAVVADLPENRVTCGSSVVYFPAGDADALAAQLERLLDNPDLYADLERRTRERAPHLLWEHSARRLVGAYRWLLAGGDPVPGDHPLPD